MYALVGITALLTAIVFFVMVFVSLVKKNNKTKRNVAVFLAAFIILTVAAVLDSDPNFDENSIKDENSLKVEETVDQKNDEIIDDNEIDIESLEEVSGEISSEESTVDAVPDVISEIMEVHFMDVDQGDATLLLSPTFTILIDAGRHDRDDVVPYLKSVGVEKIDLLIGTHPHADHIGQMDKVLTNFEVSEVWMSGNTHTSKTFERVLDAIIDSEANYNEPRAGETYQVGDLVIEMLSPKSLTDDFNNDSLAFRAIYGDMMFVFTGDVEMPVEEEILSGNYELKANIFQLGHHGSSTSNSKAFLDAISPEVVVYSSGKDNSYGHPHDEVINRLEKMNVKIYGTDIHGTIIIETDGKTYEVK